MGTLWGRGTRLGFGRRWLGQRFGVVAFTAVFGVVLAACHGAPGKPTGLSSSTSGEPLAVTVRWTAAARADAYTLYRDGALVARTGGTKLADTGVRDGETYEYKVVASNHDGSVSSDPLLVTVEAPPFDPCYEPVPVSSGVDVDVRLVDTSGDCPDDESGSESGGA